METSVKPLTHPRMGRQAFWRIFITISVVAFFVSFFLGRAYGSPLTGGGNLIVAIFSTGAIVASSIGRCHDRGKSGSFAWLLFVPILFLWPIVELLFLRGTVGPNKYGDDPLKDDSSKEAQVGSASTFSQPVKEIAPKVSTEDEDTKAIRDLKGLCALTQTAASVLTMRGYSVEISVQSTPNGITISPRISKEF